MVLKRHKPILFLRSFCVYTLLFSLGLLGRGRSFYFMAHEMGSSVVFHLQVVYSLGLSKPDLPLGVKPTRKDWGTCDAPFCAQPSSCPQVVGPQGDLWEDRGFPPALPIPQLWNKGHERGFHQTHSAHPCLPQNSH